MPSLPSKVVQFDLETRSYKELPIEELNIDPENKNLIYWIHCNYNQKDIFKQLVKKLHLTNEVVKLCQQEEGIPKLIDMGDFLSMRVQCVLSEKAEKGKDLVFRNVVIHITKTFCLTVSSSTAPALVMFNETYYGGLRYAETPCFILFLILDNIINDYSTILYDLDGIADEEDIISSQKDIYKDVMDTKNQVMKTKRHVLAMRDILMRISGRKIEVISDPCRVSLGNLFNHCQMVVTEADATREILSSTQDKMDNSLMKKLNETMKVLAAFAAIFLPINLIASIYGMNFKWMPELEWEYGYFFAIFLMFSCGGVLLYIFKKMKWF